VKILKTSKLHAKSLVEWDSIAGKKQGRIKQIMGTHASIEDNLGSIYIVSIDKIRKIKNAI